MDLWHFLTHSIIDPWMQQKCLVSFISNSIGDRISVLIGMNDRHFTWYLSNLYKFIYVFYLPLLHAYGRTYTVQQVPFNKCVIKCCCCFYFLSQFLCTFLSFTLSPVRRERDRKEKEENTYQTNYIINCVSRQSRVYDFNAYDRVIRFFLTHNSIDKHIYTLRHRSKI